MTTPTIQQRELKQQTVRYDIVVAGGGMSGIGAAMTAARHGAKVALVHDRPCLGGNASKEVRVSLCGANGGGNACFFRETGLMEELMLENQWRNPDSNPELWDTVLHDAVRSQAGLDVYLNTSVFAVQMAEGGATRAGDYGPRIASITGLTVGSETITHFVADTFIDCTGDGTVAYLAGSPFRHGREARSEFNESLAPVQASKGTMGTSVLIFGKDVGHPVEFVPPSFAYKFTEKDFRPGRHPVYEWDRGRQGFWWVEWGGQIDTVTDAEKIYFELQRIAYGIFDFLKNDPGQREKNRNITLEFVTTLGGKRESRRFEGDHILTQSDITNRPEMADAIGYGGWNMDDHAPKGFFDDERPPAYHSHIPGLYNIPLRCLYSKVIANLWFAGRNASVSHAALSTTRVILTCAQMGEAAGAAAVLCKEKGLTPRQLATGPVVKELQQRLLRDDHSIIGVRYDDPGNLAREGKVTVTASSQLAAVALDQPNHRLPLDKDYVIVFPACAGKLPWVDVLVTALADTKLAWRLHCADGRGLTIPAAQVGEGTVAVAAGGTQWVRIPVSAAVASADWHMLELRKNDAIQWHASDANLAGLRSMHEVPREEPWGTNHFSRFSRGWGKRGWTFCVRLPADAKVYAPANVINGYNRPFCSPNLWISAASDFAKPEWIEVAWAAPMTIKSHITVLFDSDLDMDVSNMWIPNKRRAAPEMVKDYDVEVRLGGKWEKVAEVRGNYQRQRVHELGKPMSADAVRVVVKATHGAPRAQVYEVRAY